MPSYELSLVIRTLARPDLVSTLKRTAEMILDHGGILRKFTSLGNKPLPYRMKGNNMWHKEATYFLIQFDAPSAAMEQVADAVRRDIDVIRPHFFKMEPKTLFSCTLEEELKPPAYRKDVEDLIQEGRRTKPTYFKRNIPGIDYNPFQK